MKTVVGACLMVLGVLFVVSLFVGNGDSSSSVPSAPSHGPNWHTIPIKGWDCTPSNIAQIEASTGGTGYCVP